MEYINPSLLIILMLLSVLIAIVLWSIWQNRRQNEVLRERVDEQLKTITQQMLETTKSVGERMDSAIQMWGDVREKLGALSQATERMQEVGESIASLEEILSPPKLRGKVGEFLLERLLSQILPPSYYTLQHSFKSGATVDALINLGTGKVPVDSKFPLDNFKRIIESKTEEERKTYCRKFVRDVKGHIDAIADKYILPEEGTFDFALMYIPAENVYYETIIKDEEGLFDYALKKRVIPVSPYSFYAYLQVIVLGLRGMRIETRAQEIMGYLGRLSEDFQRFQMDYETLGTHLRYATNKYEEADKKLVRFGVRLLSAAKFPTAELEGVEVGKKPSFP